MQAIASAGIEKQAGGAFKSLESEWKESTQGVANAFGFRRNDQQPQINWNDWNYPPFLRIVHYDREELPEHLQNIVWWLHLSWLLCLGAFGLHAFNSIVLAIGGVDPVGLLSAALPSFLIFPCLGFFTFHQGYKGIATASEELKNRYLILDCIMGLIYALFGLASRQALNAFGLIQFAFIAGEDAGSGIKGYWYFVVAVESVIFIGCLTLAVLLGVRVKRFNPYASSPSGPGGGGREPNARAVAMY
uniref:Secretory carrier membrane protein n=1 Tax=Chromera velia CCMP2878 TaxID=1169474 RepID=A0A0G4HWV5_9ALVE|mmetsp:Transcript_17672/g.35872  ORF Transcript_17672/g.35872 Transcript_17672/m.35872 type:complete len:246 (-) Transcript_17672:99-836(-)|eukprot:Cvel_1466.t1-p1 / transcript=Cvel_1466.t1 / gene=Cvel_1466 / organism=Chromera_velia_CCMP2878 / gene_product=hypothetical protein / transcript_product=hypothetical protein / location=Cvel_scaffold51:108246-111899(+) / protein_length=245 / sequence_SO=supercontig / SO=protein_coding / is_pseudo=false